jgi:hypothetical protein
MNRKQLANDIANCAPQAFDIIEREAARAEVEPIIKQTLAVIIEAVVFETCTRIAHEHLLTEPSRN